MFKMTMHKVLYRVEFEDEPSNYNRINEGYIITSIERDPNENSTLLIRNSYNGYPCIGIS